MKSAQSAFTFIELVIAITIITIIGIFAYANYKPFGEDQNLKSAVLDIQSLLRVAQTNATTNATCNGQASSTWQVEFSNTTTINLLCQRPIEVPPSLIKTLQLGANITISSVSGAVGCPFGLPFTISFTPLKSSADFEGFLNCTSLGVNLKNSKTGSTKFITIEKGGRIYAP